MWERYAYLRGLFHKCAQAKASFQGPSDLLMAALEPSTAATPRRRFDPAPLQRCQKTYAAPVPRAKDIVLIQPRLRIPSPSTKQRSEAKPRKESAKQKLKQTITKRSSLTIKTMFQRQLSANGSAPIGPEGSLVTSASNEAAVTCPGPGLAISQEYDSFKYANEVAGEVAAGTCSLQGNPLQQTGGQT